jgi:UDP-glucose:(heptosyl)LPS alpha-1,3-glucosyltransferase
MFHASSLNIAIVSLDFNRAGGSERRTAHLVDRLVGQGHAVSLVGARIHGEWDPRIGQERVHTSKHPHWLEILLFCRRARAIVQRGAFDIVHNQIRPFAPGLLTVGGGCHRFYLADVLPRERGAIRAWLKRQGPLHRVLLALERRGFDPAFCPFVLTNSALARDGILQYYSYPAERIVVAHNGVDAERFCPAGSSARRDEARRRLGIAPGDVVVLFVGSGFARKGLESVLEGAARATGKGSALRLLVVGSGAAPAWRRRAERLGMGGRVRFVGSVADPETYYRAADIFALPTHFDPFANATLEAMASGLPVITTRRNGAAEIIRAGVDGLVIDEPSDVDGLADALLALQDAKRRRDMGLRARETALRYPWEQPVQATLSVYERALAERAGRQ